MSYDFHYFIRVWTVEPCEFCLATTTYTSYTRLDTAVAFVLAAEGIRTTLDDNLVCLYAWLFLSRFQEVNYIVTLTSVAWN